jgi:peptidoglycan/LPS O-acetylase OafA/YrhL
MNSSPAKRNRVDPINFLRVTAVMMVFLLHVFLGPLRNQTNPLIFLLNTPAWAGIWIFLFISGYLIGKGFFEQRYELTMKGVLRFFWSRFLKIAPIYYVFCFLVGYFLSYDFTVGNPKVILHILTFTYNGNPGVTGIGATWYISTVMQLYLLSPFLYFLVRKMNNKYTQLSLFLLIVVAGLLLRLYLLHLGADWYSRIYTLSLSNIDIFGCGLLLNALLQGNRLSSKRHAGLLTRVTALSCLVSLIVVNCYLSFQNTPSLTTVYKYYLPSAYIIVCSFYVLAFSPPSPHTAGNEPFSWRAVLGNPFRLIDGLSIISLEFYLCHSNVKSIFETHSKYSKLTLESNLTLGSYLEFLVIVFLLTVAVSVLLHLLRNQIDHILEPSRSAAVVPYRGS